MSETLFVRPSVEGARIIDPVVGEVIPAEGKDVPANAYWRGLIIRGDVIVVDPEPAKAGKPAKIKEA